MADCQPRLEPNTGQLFSDNGKYESWRDYLYFVHSTISPSDTNLPLKNRAWGGAYYGLFYRAGSPEAVSDLNVSCREGDDGTCLINGSLVGPIEAVNSVVRVYTAVDPDTEGDTLTASVTMGAALSASGGPEVTLGKEGVAGITLTWPDSSYGVSNGMGSYVWRCLRRLTENIPPLGD
jgi:hypothetical protein